MSNKLKQRKNFTKPVLKKLTETAVTVANILMIDGLHKKTVKDIAEVRTKINGIAQMFLYIGYQPAVIELAKISKNLKFLEDNEVKRVQVWDALDKEIEKTTINENE